MASTKVPIELSSTPGIVDNSNATAITIDSSENVALTGGLTLANSQYLSSTDASSNAPRMLGINSGNTTYIAPIDAYAGGDVYYGVSANVANQAFYTAGSERLRIDSSGNVGIGMVPTTNNISKSISLVNGGSIFGYGNGTYITANSNYNGAWNTVATGVDSRILLDGNVVFSRSTSASAGSAGAVSESMRIDSSGNVGIGTSSPLAPLVISNGGAAGIELHPEITTDTNSIAHYDRTASAYMNSKVDALTHQFLTSGSERMRIDSSGNVGIGTSSPSDELHIAKTTSPRIRIDATGSTQNAELLLINSADGLYSSVVGDGNNLLLATQGSERLRIDSSGNVGIGTDSPSAVLETFGGTSFIGAKFKGYSGGKTALVGGDLNTVWFGDDDGSIGLTNSFKIRGASNIATIVTNSSERMRIDSSGNVLFGVTSDPSSSNAGAAFTAESGSRMLLKLATTATNLDTLAIFINGNGEVGNIRTTGSATQFNTSSDARLKDVTGEARGLEVINALNPVAYNWKADGQADEGLIAQEVKEIVPNAVSGSEEEQYYMDYSKLVVHLVAGMKEQQAQIEALQSEINLLKGE